MKNAEINLVGASRRDVRANNCCDGRLMASRPKTSVGDEVTSRLGQHSLRRALQPNQGTTHFLLALMKDDSYDNIYP